MDPRAVPTPAQAAAALAAASGYATGGAWSSTAGGSTTIRGRRFDGPGATLHFLSGNGFCGGVYWPFLRELLSSHSNPAAQGPGHGLFTHDIEGQGDSDAAPRFAGVTALERRILAVIDDQKPAGPGGLIGIGHSFGAAMTLRVAAARPGLFRAVVLLDPILFPPPVWLVFRSLGTFRQHPLANAARRRRDRWPSAQAVADHLRGRGTYRGWTEEALQCFALHATRDAEGGRALSCPREAEAQGFEHPPWCWGALRRIEAPILLLRGTESFPFFPAAEWLARRTNPRVEVERIGGGHCFMLEDPAAAARPVRAFLERALQP